jgi:trimethylamine:corrinoid methyltransferase-like protein
MASRLLEGVCFRGSPEALQVLRDHAADKSFLTADHTRRYFRDEARFPSELIDRGPQGEWEAAGRPDAMRRAADRVRSVLSAASIDPPDGRLVDHLESIVAADARKLGVDSLPDWRALLP